MKLHLILPLLVLSACVMKQKPKPTPTDGVVRVLSYSSMGSSHGFLKSVQERFQAESKCELKIETTLGAAQILTHLKQHPGSIDFVVGIDRVLFDRGREYWESNSVYHELSKKVNWNKLVVAGVDPDFFPLDYGALTFIFQKEKIKSLKLNPPKSVNDLLSPEYKKKFIVQDPRVSSPGMYFFSWLPRSFSLSKLKNQWLALAQSWDSSYQMFLQGEAPMVWSYLSSMAYHESKGEGDRFGFVDFKEGLPIHLEGMAKVKPVQKVAGDETCAQKWLEFVYTPATQRTLVETQFMLPVVSNVEVPAAFQKISTFNHFARSAPTVADVDALLSRFGKEVQGDSW